MSNYPISENDLHAYVDAVLPAVKEADVAAYLAAHPDTAERVLAYQAQKLALAALFNPALDEALPQNLHALALPPPEVRAESGFMARRSLQRIAAGVLLVLVGGAAGWLAQGQYQAAASIARLSPLARQAAVAHAVFSPDLRRPVEVGAEHEDQLVAWLSKRMGRSIRPPRLGPLGFEMIGGRLLPGNSEPVAQFMYQDAAGQRLTLYVSTENTANQETAFRFAQEGKVNVFYWIDGEFGYALSASIAKDQLARVATAVYDQIEHK